MRQKVNPEIKGGPRPNYLERIKRMIPHRDPFLLLDSVRDGGFAGPRQARQPDHHRLMPFYLAALRAVYKFIVGVDIFWGHIHLRLEPCPVRLEPDIVKGANLQEDDQGTYNDKDSFGRQFPCD